MNLARFEWLTFDCYGTLIDWESGIAAALKAVQAARGLALDEASLLASFGRHEAAVEAGPFQSYRGVLRQTLARIGDEFGFAPSPGECDRFADSVGDWPPFDDTIVALQALKRRYRLAILSNVDDDLFARTAHRLGVDFDGVITAQQVGSYKPAPGHFERAEAQLGIAADRWLHVAQSRFHDIAPAQARGIATVWVNRPSRGAVPRSEIRADLEVPDLETLAHRAGVLA